LTAKVNVFCETHKHFNIFVPPENLFSCSSWHVAQFVPRERNALAEKALLAHREKIPRTGNMIPKGNHA
jgi:hypothetical protein